MVRNCGKDWAIAEHLESPLEICCSRELRESNETVSTSDPDVALTSRRSGPRIPQWLFPLTSVEDGDFHPPNPPNLAHQFQESSAMPAPWERQEDLPLQKDHTTGTRAYIDLYSGLLIYEALVSCLL